MYYTREEKYPDLRLRIILHFVSRTYTYTSTM